MNKVQNLPTTVMINAGRLSSLLDETIRGTAKRPTANDPEIPRLSAKQVNKAESYVYQSFRFRPDGSTDLPSAGENQWYLTLHGVNERIANETTKPPPNFFTVQVDPVSGATRSFSSDCRLRSLLK